MFSKRSTRNSISLTTNYISTVFGISLVLFMIGVIMGSVLLLKDLEKQFRENLQGDIFFLVPDYNDSDIKLVEEELKNWPEFKEVVFVSPERALDILFEESEMDDISQFEIDSMDNLLPASISFKPVAEYSSLEGMKKIETKIKNKFGQKIESVNYDKQSIESLDKGFNQFSFVFIFVTALLVGVAAALINNTIRLSVYSRRFTIKTMQLVGATGGFIRRPFILHAILQGFISSLIGLSLTMTVFYALDNTIDSVDFSYTLGSFILLTSSIFAVGLFLTVISTWLALNNYLRKKIDTLY